jgi:hypothetical protein
MVVLNNDVLGIIYSYLPSKFKLLTQKNDLVSKIISYLPIQDKLMLNKRYYNSVEKNIVIKNKDSFYIHLVRKNNQSLLTKYIAREKIENWFKKKKHYFKNNVFNNFISLLEHVSIQYKSNQTRLIINDLCKYNMLNKNKHKHKIYKNIIWN